MSWRFFLPHQTLGIYTYIGDNDGDSLLKMTMMGFFTMMNITLTWLVKKSELIHETKPTQ